METESTIIQDGHSPPDCPDDCKRYHDRAFIAARFSVSHRTIYNWVRDRGFPETALGTYYCPDVKAWLHRRGGI